MEFCNFGKIGLKRGRPKNLLKAAAFSTWTEIPCTKNKNYETGNTTCHKLFFL